MCDSGCWHVAYWCQSISGMLLIKRSYCHSWFCFYTCTQACSCSIITPWRSLHCILSRCWLTRGFTGMLLWSGQIWHCGSLVVIIDQTSFWSILFSTAKFNAVVCVCALVVSVTHMHVNGWLPDIRIGESRWWTDLVSKKSQVFGIPVGSRGGWPTQNDQVCFRIIYCPIIFWIIMVD